MSLFTCFAWLDFDFVLFLQASQEFYPAQISIIMRYEQICQQTGHRICLRGCCAFCSQQALQNAFTSNKKQLLASIPPLSGNLFHVHPPPQSAGHTVNVWSRSQASMQNTNQLGVSKKTQMAREPKKKGTQSQHEQKYPDICKHTCL